MSTESTVDINLPAVMPIDETDAQSDETPVIYPDTNPSGELQPLMSEPSVNTAAQSAAQGETTMRELIAEP